MSSPGPAGKRDARRSVLVGQFLRFGLVGLLGFAIDTGLTVGLERIASLPPFAARPPAIVAAMLVTWWLNRAFSFRVTAPLSSLGRYALVVAVAALLNYLLFLVGVGYGMGTVAAIFAATAVSMVFSFLGYRHFAFGAYAQAGSDSIPGEIGFKAGGPPRGRSCRTSGE